MSDLIKDNPHFKSSRLGSLYSNFDKLEHLNPEGYAANLESWANLLGELAQNGLVSASKVSISTRDPDLETLLTIPVYGKPLSLGTVLNQAVLTKSFIPYTNYKAYASTYYDVIDESVRLQDYLSPTKWLHWGLKSLDVAGGFNSSAKNGTLKPERYIHWNSLVELGQKCHNFIQTEVTSSGTFSAKLYDSASLYSFLQQKVPDLSEIDFAIVLIYISRDLQKYKVKVADNVTYIKYGPEEITEDDMRIIAVKSALLTLQNRRLNLQNKVDGINQEMRSVLSIADKQDQKSRLKHLLKLKLVMTKSLDHVSGSHNELNTIMVKINDSTMNIDLHNQLVNSSKLLKSLNSKIDIDDVDRVKDEIEEEIGKTNEISEALGGVENVEDYEIEEEFNRIYEQEAEKKQENDSNESLLQKLDDLKIDKKEVKEKNSHKEPILEAI